MSRQIGWPEGDKRGVRECHAESLGDDLRCGGSAQELTTPTGTRTGPAAELRGFGQGELAMRIPRTDRLDLAGVFTVARRQRHTSRDQHRGKLLRARQGHHHRGESLIARRDP